MKKIKYRTIKILTILLLVITCIPVQAKDLPANRSNDDCPTCSAENAPHYIDEDAVKEYQYLASISEQFNAEQAINNPFNNITRNTRASVVSQAWANSGINRFYQTDYNDKLCPNSDTSKTIASDGCVVTSFAMIASKYGINTNPVHVKDRFNADAPGTESGCNFPWFNAVTVYPFTSLKAQEITNKAWSISYDNIEGALLLNRPVLAFMNGPTGTHAVVVYGYERYSDGGEYHYIFNPDPRNSAHQMSLEEYQRDGWSVNRLMVYYK